MVSRSGSVIKLFHVPRSVVNMIVLPGITQTNHSSYPFFVFSGIISRYLPSIQTQSVMHADAPFYIYNVTI